MGKENSSSPERSDGSGSRKPPLRKPGPPKLKGSKKKSGGGLSSVSIGVGLLAVGLVVVPIIGYIAQYIYMQFFYLPSLVSTPSDLPKVLDEDAFSAEKSPDMFWGTYAANLYFGLKTRSPLSPQFGIMWYDQPRFEVMMPPIRHWSNQDDKIVYGWSAHDGKTFGLQQITDQTVKYETSFVKRPGGTAGGDWTARIHAKRQEQLPPTLLTSVIFYFMFPHNLDGARMSPLVAREVHNGLQFIDGLEGFAPQLGSFKLRFVQNSDFTISTNSYAAVEHKGSYSSIKEAIINATDIHDINSMYMKHYMGLRHKPKDGQPPTTNPNLIALQVTFASEMLMDVVFESGSYRDRPDELSGKVFKTHFELRKSNFDQKFEQLFQLTSQNYADVFQAMGKFALSNMLGSVSYFHGSSKVISQYNSKPVPYGPFQLFTAIPSRPFFPRGFLWDEGFHHLLIRQWDEELSLEILGSWLDLMNIEGWIPREQILGEEAEQRVPAEYVVQRNALANPPMFFFLLQQHLNSAQNWVEKHPEFSKRAYPRLKLWYNWLNASQSGPLMGTYRWRGRNATTNLQLNPLTLTSGLDDYPRASHPTDEEYHVDLLCWMAVSSKLMVSLAEQTGNTDDLALLKETADVLSDERHFNRLHWSEKTKRYCDYGLHTRNVKLERPQPKDPMSVSPHAPLPPMVRVVRTPPKERLVSDTFGYVSLFPFLTTLLSPSSTQLSAILKDLTSPDLLWTPFGLRSLSKTSPLYDTRNTEHDPPYWRGSIWMNLNYLAARALHHYSNAAGPNRDAAFETYSQLRANLIGNVMRQYASTGFLWEHYNDETGAGEGCHPFTGWTSLILKIMAEKYD